MTFIILNTNKKNSFEYNYFPNKIIGCIERNDKQLVIADVINKQNHHNQLFTKEMEEKFKSKPLLGIMTESKPRIKKPYSLWLRYRGVPINLSKGVQIFPLKRKENKRINRQLSRKLSVERIKLKYRLHSRVIKR